MKLPLIAALVLTLATPALADWQATLGAARGQTVYWNASNYALPDQLIATEKVHMKLGNAELPIQALIQRIDSDHANARQRWQEMGSQEYLSAAIVTELNAVSRCKPEPKPFDFRDGALGFDVILPPLAVAAVAFLFAERDRG